MVVNIMGIALHYIGGWKPLEGENIQMSSNLTTGNAETAPRGEIVFSERIQRNRILAAARYRLSKLEVDEEYPPSHDAAIRARAFITAIYTEYGSAMPLPMAYTSIGRGIDLRWETDGRKVQVHFPEKDSDEPYIYHETPGSHTVVHGVNPGAVANLVFDL